VWSEVAAARDGERLEVTTDGRPRPLLRVDEVPPRVRRDFDYLRDGDGARLVEYRGSWYDAYDNEGVFPHDRRWFYASDSFFSGMLFRFPHDDDVVVGRYVVRG
jgi:hypothetical protein